MKLLILSLLSSSLIYLSKCQNIVLPTNYTLSYFQESDEFQTKCTSDKDCPLYSTCENVSGKDYSICKFGDFLCPGRTDGFFMNKEIVEDTCIYVNSTMYDVDKEAVRKNFSNNGSPILKTCSSGDYDCSTPACGKNSDCLSGLCMGRYCVNNDDLNNEIYRCSPYNIKNSDGYYMVCKKVNGMKCAGDSDCYSGHCNSFNDYVLNNEYNNNEPPLRFCSLKESRESVTLLAVFLTLVFFALILIPICYFTPKDKY